MIKLQSLRIPTGWKVSYNKFLEIEPSGLEENDNVWIHFTQDILQLEYIFKEAILIVDLGWYPETEINGTFRLMLIKDEEWESPLEVFESKNKEEIVEKIEKIIEDISEGYKYI